MIPRRLALLFLAFFLGSVQAAEKPSLDHLFPPAAARGSTNEITFYGKFDPWPPQAWASAAGLDFQFTTNKGKALLTVGDDAPAGPCLVRLFNAEGPSDARIFVITDHVEPAETEPNNHFSKAQSVTNLPVTINGRLEKNGDVDCFRFEMKTGEWLDAALDSYTLMAKLDPVLRLLTTNGFQLAWNHDYASLDPRLIWQAPYDLTVVLQVFGFVYPADSDIRLSGAPADVYRLHLSVASQAPPDFRESSTEAEPNDSTNSAPKIELPARIVGAIGRSGDVDRFRFFAANGQFIEARVSAASIGSPLDPWVAIESSARELARSDDAGNSRDSRVEWKAPADGEYFAAVGSTTHQGGSEFRYHLDLHALEPDYTLASASDSVILTSGTTNTLKLNFKRLRGFTNELRAAVTPLPQGVTCEPVTLPAKDGEVTLTFISATNALPTNAVFSIRAFNTSADEARTVPFEFVSRTENNGVPGGYSKLLVERTGQLWLTVKGPVTSEKK